MPLTRPIVLAKIVSAGNENFNLLGPIPGGHRYLADSHTSAAPYSFDIKHQTQKTSTGLVDRRNILVSRSVLCADGVYRRVTCNHTITVPQDSAFTAAILGDTIGMSGGLWYISGERAALLLGYS